MNAVCNKLVWLAGLALLGACTVGPNYVRPVADKPVAYKEMDGWKTAQPRDQELRGKWWEAYNDPLLNGMMEQVSISNQNLVQGAAQFRQARALVQSARAFKFWFWPTKPEDDCERVTPAPAETLGI